MPDDEQTEKEAGFSSDKPAEENYLYEVKKSLVSETEKAYLKAIKSVLPAGYYLQPQVNLASVVYRTDNFKFQNELYRNIDACVFDREYRPVLLLEINDDTHNAPDRKERDRKVRDICEEAGIPLITLWTTYGINPEYIGKRITSGIEESKHPVRIAHSKNKQAGAENTAAKKKQESKKEGCYIATAVYGSYDCPQVRILRRYRDDALSATILGRAFIRAYYFISPWLVANFADKKWFNRFFRKRLDKMVARLK